MGGNSNIYQVVETDRFESADELTDFSFPWLDQPAPATRFRAWQWDGIFNFRFEVVDSDLVLHEAGDDDEKALGSDRVELFFSPTVDLLKPYYGFEMDPRGLIYDYKGEYHRKFDPSWTLPEFTTCAEITSDGYTVAGQVPMGELAELGCLRGKEMITGVYRAEFSHNRDGSVREEWISWVDPGTETPDFHVPESFGLFVFG